MAKKAEIKAEILIYSTPTCPYCNMAKDFFMDKGIAYKDLNVAADTKARKTMIDKSGQMGVPVIIINKDAKEEIIVGFDRERLETLFP